MIHFRDLPSFRSLNVLMQSGATETPDAAYITGQVEWDHWSQAGNAGFDEKVRPLEDRFSFINPDDELAPGRDELRKAGEKSCRIG